jgi:hypothetical protein
MQPQGPPTIVQSGNIQETPQDAAKRTSIFETPSEYLNKMKKTI